MLATSNVYRTRPTEASDLPHGFGEMQVAGILIQPARDPGCLRRSTNSPDMRGLPSKPYRSHCNTVGDIAINRFWVPRRKITRSAPRAARLEPGADALDGLVGLGQQ